VYQICNLILAVAEKTSAVHGRRLFTDYLSNYCWLTTINIACEDKTCYTLSGLSDSRNRDVMNRIGLIDHWSPTVRGANRESILHAQQENLQDHTREAETIIMNM